MYIYSLLTPDRPCYIIGITNLTGELFDNNQQFLIFIKVVPYSAFMKVN